MVGNIEILRDRENYYIELYDVTNHTKGYNILNNTNIGLGVSASAEVKEKISASCLGEKNGHFGKYHSDVTKQRISEIKKQRSEELRREKLRVWISEHHCCEICGKVMTEKYGSGRFCSKQCANKSISIKNKQVIHTAEWNKKMQTSLTGKQFTDEHKQKLSAVAKERFAVAENNPMFGKHHSEETRKKISAKLKSTDINSSRFAGHTHTAESKKKISESLKRGRYSK